MRGSVEGRDSLPVYVTVGHNPRSYFLKKGGDVPVSVLFEDQEDYCDLTIRRTALNWLVIENSFSRRSFTC